MQSLQRVKSVVTDRSAGKAFLTTIAGIYLVSYLLRYIYLYYFVSRNYPLTDVNPEWNAILLDPLKQSFLICSTIFAIFFAAGIPGQAKKSNTRIAYQTPDALTQIGLMVFIICCGFMRYLFGARLGEESITLPLGISALVNRSISELIPGLILLMMEAFWFNDSKGGYRFWLLVLAVFNISIAAIAASKAGMVFFATELILFMYLTGQPIIQKPFRWVVVGVFVVAAFIVGSEIRSRTISGSSSEYFYLIGQGDYIGTLLLVVGALVNRLIGLEGYTLSCGYSCSTMPGVIIPSFNSFLGEAGDIFTQQVIGVQRDFDYRSPGLLGGAALIGGVYGGALLAVAFLRGCLGAIRLTDRAVFSIAFKVSIVFGLFRFVLEGTWDAVNLVALLGGAVLVELAARLLYPRTEQAVATHLRAGAYGLNFDRP